MTRRRVLLASVAAVISPSGSAPAAALVPVRRRLGITSASYWKRWKGAYSNLRFPAFRDPLDLMDHVRSLGIGSVQMPVEGWNAQLAKKVRATGESYGMQIEGSIRLPQSPGDVERFNNELRIAQAAGATVFRTALGGRRYETFTRLEDFESWKGHAQRSVELAEPSVRRLRVRIGIENHKDLECHELLTTLRHISSEHIGACIDTGNSIALLEDPSEVVRALAPFVVTIHLKDMAVKETADGFQLAEVPLGEGFLNLPLMVQTLLAANPKANFHLEMITRDPLPIPCLREEYWATFPKKPAVDLAHMLSLVRTARSTTAPAKTDNMPTEAALELEEKNIVRSLVYAGSALGFEAPKVSITADESHGR